MDTSKSPDTIRKVPFSTEAEAESEDEKEEILMPAPPIDWEFNSLLTNIAAAMTSQELEVAKAIFKGDDGFRRGLLSKIKTTLEFFDCLQKYTFLSRNNLLYLQAMLYQLGRMDLYDLAISYAQSLKDVIYFCTPQKEPANGYKYIQFHIKGKDFKKVKRSSLEHIREIAARLMLVPQEFVVIAGIEPSSSLLITLMVPKRFIKYFEAALHKEPVEKELIELGIDIVRIDDKVVNIQAIEDVDILIETEEQTKLKTIYDQLQLAKERLEDRDTECLQLKRRLDFEYNQKISTDYQMKAVLIKILVEHQSNQKIPKLSKQSAFVFFQDALRQVKQLNYDKDIIALLLDAQAAVLSTRVQDNRQFQLKALLFENQRLRDCLFQFQVAYAQLQILNTLDNPEYQKKFIESIKALVQGQRPEVSRVVEFNPVVLLILKEISGMLQEKDRKALVSAYIWPDTDELTKQLKNDANALLAILVAKETIEKGGEIPLVEFIHGKLADVKREDLKIIFDALMAQYMSKTEYTYIPPAPGGTLFLRKGIIHQQPTVRQQSKTTKRRSKSESRQQQSKPTVQPTEAKPTQEELLADLLKKVNHMEGMMQDSLAAYKSSTFGADVFPQNLLLKQDPRKMVGRYIP